MQDGKIRFEQLPNNDTVIEVGAQVVTSHISSKYLPGILIGYVSEIEVDSNNLTRSGLYYACSRFRQHLQEVLVITTTKDDLVNARSEEAATDTDKGE